MESGGRHSRLPQPSTAYAAVKPFSVSRLLTLSASPPISDASIACSYSLLQTTPLLPLLGPSVPASHQVPSSHPYLNYQLPQTHKRVFRTTTPVSVPSKDRHKAAYVENFWLTAQSWYEPMQEARRSTTPPVPRSFGLPSPYARVHMGRDQSDNPLPLR